jgi:hypothetical protein
MCRFMRTPSLILVLFALVWMALPLTGSAQCTDQLTHTTGSAVVAGVNVTVTSTGNTCAWNTYCPSVTSPYFIGYNPGLGSGSGSFTFTFSPAINGIRLNFSGASCDPSNCEEVRLHINGSHYAMASVGTNNACDPMAVLTGAGDLQGCSGCGVSGWSGTSISGFPISTLTVEDYVLRGTPNGALFSLWICPAILPAEWLQFTAALQTDRSVALDWTTQTEINNDFFTVERSTDGLSWSAIGQVDGAGNSDAPRSYSFIDSQPSVGTNHYRIRQTSLDGSASNSVIETVHMAAGQGIQVSPNPARDFVQIEMAGIDQVTVTLRNQLGQVVEVARDVLADKMILHTADLPKGVYFVEIRTAQQSFLQKVVVH